MATDWGSYGIRPGGDTRSRRFVVTAQNGITVSGRHYPRGSTIARRQGENLRLMIDGGGWQSYSEWRRVTLSEHYQGWQRQVARKFSTDPRTLRKPDSSFNRAYVRWMRQGFTKSSRPKGRFAKFLVGIGFRDPRATYPVGDTPKKGKRK